MLEMSKDETLNGLARGFAFRLVEEFGLIKREAVLSEVKDLDQDARGTLRKHGVRFGQFTIFLPLMLKPAATRLRMVLWSLSKGLAEFPENPPPGLVTIPSDENAPEGYHTMCGYRRAGVRAIRVDMLERLADMLRVLDSRGGFEANPDMLSITGMTLEQFADLMKGLGYSADRGEREKVKVAQEGAETKADTKGDGSVKDGEEKSVEVDVEPSADAPETPEVATEEKPEEAPEPEVYYVFRWRGNRPAKPAGKPRGKPNRGKPGAKRAPKSDKPASYAAKPPKKATIDPDNPFAAALMGLVDKT